MERAIIAGCSIFGAAIIAAIAAFGAAQADSVVAAKAVESIARQPEARQSILVTMLISVGLIESIPIIAAVIAVVLVFANPFLG